MKPTVNAEPLPNDLLQFIVDSIDTVPELEALLIVQDDSKREWAVDDIAERLYVSTREAAAIVTRLQRRELVVEGSTSGRYRFSSATPEAELVDRLAKTYARHVTLIARIIHAKPASAVREFAKAFKVTPEDRG